MSVVNFDNFKENLLSRGVDWSDQQIRDYLAAQKDRLFTSPIFQNDLAGEIFNVVQKFEYRDSARSQRHNNPGGHIYTSDLGANFGATKGESFTGKDREGNDITLYTAKYDTLDKGEKASLHVTNKIMNRVVKQTGLYPNDPGFGEAFATEYDGSDSPQTITNYGGAIDRAIGQYTTTMPTRQVAPVAPTPNLFEQAQGYRPPGWEDPVDTA